MSNRLPLDPELRPYVREVAEAVSRATPPAHDDPTVLLVDRWRLERAVGGLRYLAWLDPPNGGRLGRSGSRDTLVAVRFDASGALAFCVGHGWIRLGQHVFERSPDHVREELEEAEEHMARLRLAAQEER